MTDLTNEELVRRLRYEHGSDLTGLMCRAANRIEALAKENAELHKEIEGIYQDMAGESI